GNADDRASAGEAFVARAQEGALVCAGDEIRRAGNGGDAERAGDIAARNLRCGRRRGAKSVNLDVRKGAREQRNKTRRACGRYAWRVFVRERRKACEQHFIANPLFAPDAKRTLQLFTAPKRFAAIMARRPHNSRSPALREAIPPCSQIVRRE